MNQSEDIPGMSFLNSAFDSSTFIRTNYNYMQSLAAANAATISPTGQGNSNAQNESTFSNCLAANNRASINTSNTENNSKISTNHGSFGLKNTDNSMAGSSAACMNFKIFI